MIEKSCAHDEDDETRAATIYAIAMKLDTNYIAYNEVTEWSNKIMPNKKANKSE